MSAGELLCCLSEERRTLVSDVTKDVDRDTDVVGDETLVVEGVHNGVKALEEGQEAGKDKGKVGKVWLEWLLIVSISIVYCGSIVLTALYGRVSLEIP